LEHLQIADDDEFASVGSSFDVEDIKAPKAMWFGDDIWREIGESDLPNRPIRGDLLNVAGIGPRGLDARVGIGKLNLIFCGSIARNVALIVVQPRAKCDSANPLR